MEDEIMNLVSKIEKIKSTAEKFKGSIPGIDPEDLAKRVAIGMLISSGFKMIDKDTKELITLAQVAIIDLNRLEPYVLEAINNAATGIAQQAKKLIDDMINGWGTMINSFTSLVPKASANVGVAAAALVPTQINPGNVINAVLSLKELITTIMTGIYAFTAPLMQIVKVGAIPVSLVIPLLAPITAIMGSCKSASDSVEEEKDGQPTPPENTDEDNASYDELPEGNPTAIIGYDSFKYDGNVLQPSNVFNNLVGKTYIMNLTCGRGDALSSAVIRFIAIIEVECKNDFAAKYQSGVPGVTNPSYPTYPTNKCKTFQYRYEIVKTADDKSVIAHSYIRELNHTRTYNPPTTPIDIFKWTDWTALPYEDADGNPIVDENEFISLISKFKSEQTEDFEMKNGEYTGNKVKLDGPIVNDEDSIKHINEDRSLDFWIPEIKGKGTIEYTHLQLPKKLSDYAHSSDSYPGELNKLFKNWTVKILLTDGKNGESLNKPFSSNPTSNNPSREYLAFSYSFTV